MKLQVTVKISSDTKAPATLDLVVLPMDTVFSVKQRIASTMMIPFPDQELACEGLVLTDEQKLLDCGLKEGSSLIFTVKASVATLTQQLKTLLQGNAASAAELGLLYSHKHGVAVGAALEMVGIKPNLEAFLQNDKAFCFNSAGGIEVRDTGEAVCSAEAEVEEEDVVQDALPSEECEVEVTVNPHVKSKLGSDEVITVTVNINETVGTIQQRVAESLALPFHDCDLLLNGQLLKAEQTLRVAAVEAAQGAEEASVAFAYHCSERLLTEQLSAILQDRLMTLRSLSEAYTCRYGLNVQQALKSMGKNENLQDFVQRLERFKLDDQVVSISSAAPQPPSEPTVESLQALLQKLKSSDYPQEIHGLEEQSDQVKAVMRLLKWWRDQQTWSSPTACPSRELLELVAVITAARAADISAAVGNAMQFMARIDEAKVSWNGDGHFQSSIALQRPLMPDPANPARNVADPDMFDPRELMFLARSSTAFC